MSELYVRWLQFGMFNPLSRAHHEGNNAAEPWLFGAEAEKICKDAIQLKYRLFPYIYSYAREAHDTGMPIMRAMLLEYPNDTRTYSADGQFMFGKELLVAPVVEKGAVSKEVYLPEGEWIDYNDGKTVYKGSKQITVNAPLNMVPIFVKKGSVIPTMPVMQYIHERPSYPVIFDVFPASLNKEASFILYEDEGENRDYERDIYCKTEVIVKTVDSGFSVKIRGEEKGFRPLRERNFVLKIHSPEKPKKVLANAVKLKRNKSDILKLAESGLQIASWRWNEKEAILYVNLPDTGADWDISVNH